MKILVCDEIAESGLGLLRDIPGAEVEKKTKLSEAELVKTVPGYHALVVRSATKITPPVMEAATDLQVIARAGMGYDNINVEAATRKGVVVMNTPGRNAITTAEHTIAMMMALARNIPQAHSTLHAGKWDKKSYVGTELAGKTLGVVGLGNIGGKVAERARGLKMEVVGYDPHIPEKIFEEVGAKKVELEELYRSSDVITLHSVLNESTRHLINSDTLAKMKTGVRIINCARGGLVDESALLTALQDGKVAGAALDVFSSEPISPDHPLLKDPRVITTPHLGASTTEAQQQVIVAAVEQLHSFFVDGVVVNGVNVPGVSREVMKALGQYIDVAGRMGKLLGQLKLPPLEEITIECSGEITKHDTSPISAAVLTGLLSQHSSMTLNFVNAALNAKERGLQVKESRTTDAKDYVSLVTVKVKGGDQTALMAGSVFGHEKGRLVRFNDFYMEVVPSGHILLVRNDDVPGIIGSWGTIMGKRNINIARVQVALDEEKGQAMSFLNIDSKASDDVLEELRQVPGIQSVQQVKL